MLVNMEYVLKWAEEHNCGIGAFNTPASENMIAVIRAAEKLNVPVIIMHAEVHNPQAPIEYVGPMMKLLAEQAKVPVCVHLDHCLHRDFMMKAIHIGFTSIMFDASYATYEENVRLVKETVEMVKPLGISVEAEIGIMGGAEARNQRLTHAEMYTDPLLAKKFVQDTGVDALACSFGTSHGIYTAKPKLDLERVKKIKELTGIPIVMHGGSGLSDEDYVNAVNAGVRKINAYSYISRKAAESTCEFVKNGVPPFYLDVVNNAMDTIQAEVERMMHLIYKI